MSALQLLLSRLQKVRKSGNGFIATCPAHDDSSPSLSVKENEKGDVVLHCHAGCAYADIMSSVGLKQSDGFADGLDKTKLIQSKISALESDKIYHEMILSCAKGDEKEGLLTDEGRIKSKKSEELLKSNNENIYRLQEDLYKLEQQKKLQDAIDYENCIINNIVIQTNEDLLILNSAKKELERLEGLKDSEKKAPEKTVKDNKGNGIFSPLGYDDGFYFYMVHATGLIVKIPRGGHGNTSLMLSIAPLEWFEATYPKEKGSGVEWQVATNSLMRMCESKGMFSRELERGAGAWFDEGRTVLHLGKYLLVDNKKINTHEIESHFFYPRRQELDIFTGESCATTEQSRNISSIFNDLRFENPFNAMLLSGWCALAPICGALKWRPHVWLTAQRGAGKSWIQDRIIAPLLGRAALIVQGSTTEAGIRQRLKQDARPIIFDEAESDDVDSQKRIKMVIELARLSSSESASEIIKGNPNGEEMAFKIRSMFLLGSINVSLSRASDLSRFCILSLNNPNKDKNSSSDFLSLSRKVETFITEKSGAQVRARIYGMILTIRENADIIASAIAESCGSRRTGDQIGTLLAGWYAMNYDGIISSDDAKKLAGDFLDIQNQTDGGIDDAESDEEDCLNKILQYQVSFDTDFGRKTRTIEEVIQCAAGKLQIEGLFYKDANKILLRHGLNLYDNIKNDEQGYRYRIIISNSHRGLTDIMRGTAWAVSWKNVICRIEGSKKILKRFSEGVARGVSVPVDFLISNEQKLS